MRKLLISNRMTMFGRKNGHLLRHIFKLIFFSVALTSIIFIISTNLGLSFYIPHRVQDDRFTNGRISLVEHLSLRSSVHSQMDMLSGMFDDSRRYQLFPNALVGPTYDSLSSNSSVTMATQTSFERMYELHELVSRWDGALSVAIFAPFADMALSITYIRYVQRCQPLSWSAVSFSFLVPAEGYPGHRVEDHLAPSAIKLRCSSPLLVHNQLLAHSNRIQLENNQNRSLIYPQNHMRNLARKTTLSRYTYLVDVDTLPVKGMLHRLEHFLQQHIAKQCEKCAFVIPAFEVSRSEKFPDDFSELASLVRRKKAQPFHQTVFKKNQAATDSRRWLKQAGLSNRTRILYQIKYETLYEPFYVAQDHVPAHDTRFVGYGFTRNSQAYEMNAAGYRFLALAPIFSVHWGLHINMTYPRWRMKQIQVNYKKFQHFKREIKTRYMR